MTGRRGWAALLGLLVAVLLVGCSSGGGSAGERAGGEAAAPEAPEAVAPEAAEEPEVAEEPEAAVPEAGEPEAAEPAQQGGDEDIQGLDAPLPPPVPVGDRLVREGTVGIEVPEDGFDEAYAAVVQLAEQHEGGVVASATDTESGGGGTSGSVTVRVPVENYDRFLSAISVGVGEVRTRDISTTDASGGIIDLRAQEQTLESQQDYYRGLFEQATQVRDAMEVREQLDSVTTELEQVRGRLAALEDRTVFSTLTVQLFEPGTDAAYAAEPEGPSLPRAWRTATRTLVAIAAVLLVVASYLVPVALVGLVLWLLWRQLRRRMPPPPAPPAPAEREREMSA